MTNFCIDSLDTQLKAAIYNGTLNFFQASLILNALVDIEPDVHHPTYYIA